MLRVSRDVAELVGRTTNRPNWLKSHIFWNFFKEQIIDKLNDKLVITLISKNNPSLDLPFCLFPKWPI